MRHLALGLLLALGSTVGARACLNFSDVDLHGHATYNLWVTDSQHLSTHEPRSVWESRRDKLVAAMKAKPPTTRERADLGAVLAHLGEYEQARTTLEEAEKLEPGDYAVASNLGTVYELLGDNAKAYQWIEKGMQRSATSHEGTEWLHLRILQVKMELAKDPTWLKTHTVLGSEVDYGPDPAPKPAAPGSNDGRIRALAYQLHERLEFIKPPEPVVGELLFDLANEVALKGAVSGALSIYEFAERFQPARTELLRQRIQHCKLILAKAPKSKFLEGARAAPREIRGGP